jgi:hypothetical protein
LFLGIEEDDEEECNLLRIYKKFLIGTEVCETIYVDDTDHLLTIADVARTYPTSLQQLCEVKTGFGFIAHYLLLCGKNHAEKEAIFNKYFKVKSKTNLHQLPLIVIIIICFSAFLSY